MGRKKCYEDGGLTFAEMSDEERGQSARSALEDLMARQAAKSEEAGGEPEVKETPRAKPAAKPAAKAAPKAEPKPEPKAEPKAERTASKVNPITGPEPAKSRAAAMPDVGARKAATEARTGRRSAFGGGAKGVYGMAAGGKVSSASKRADGCAVKGKTKGRMV